MCRPSRNSANYLIKTQVRIQTFTTTSKYEILTLTRFHTHLCTYVLKGEGLRKVQTYFYCALELLFDVNYRNYNGADF